MEQAFSRTELLLGSDFGMIRLVILQFSFIDFYHCRTVVILYNLMLQ